MIRALLYALISIIAITFVRMVAGIVMKSVGDAFKDEAASSKQTASSRGSGAVPTGGELKACRSCGTYVVTAAAKTSVIDGKTHYFCSDDCKKRG